MTILRSTSVLFAAAALAACVPPTSDDESGESADESALRAGPATYTPFALDSVNAASFWQSSEDVNVFYGRKMYFAGLPGEDPNVEGTWHYWTPAVFHYDRVNRGMHFVRRSFDVQPGGSFVMADGGHVISGYDTTVVVHQGERLMAFECGVVGLPGTVGACLGTIDSDGRLDPAHTRLVVQGISESHPNADYVPSGSVPKLYEHPDGRLGIMWSDVNVRRTPPLTFERITSRGVWLERTANGWFARGANGHAVPADSALTIEVAAGPPTGTFDLSQIANLPGNGQYLSLALTGGPGCTMPLDTLANCYQLDLRIAPLPHYLDFELNTDVVNAMMPVLTDLPRNAATYPRLVRDEQGGYQILVEMLPPNPNTPGFQIASGMYLISHPALTSYATAPRDTSPLDWHALVAGKQRNIVRLYQGALARTPSLSDIQIWMDAVRQQTIDCSRLSYDFFYSPEFAAWRANATPTEIVTRMYRGMLGREPDAAGLAQWVTAYATLGFDGVFNGFVGSHEAALRCATDAPPPLSQ